MSNQAHILFDYLSSVAFDYRLPPYDLVLVIQFVVIGVSRLNVTDRNRPKRTYENTEMDFYGYRNGPERTSVGTETDRNRFQLIPKQTSMGTRKGRVGYDRNDPNKIMYVLVGI